MWWQIFKNSADYQFKASTDILRLSHTTLQPITENLPKSIMLSLQFSINPHFHGKVVLFIFVKKNLFQNYPFYL